MGEACLLLDQSQQIGPVLFSEVAPLTWYALRVRNGSEGVTADALEQRGVRAYCPTQKERRQYSDRVKVVEKPLFSGYIFSSFGLEKKTLVLGCPGVSYVVGYGGEWSILPDSQIESIRRLVDAGAVSTEPLAVGQRVRITQGALAGVEGTLLREPRGNKLVVSIEILNRAASLYIGGDQASVVLVSK
jgi:transcription termination/antitermination protein NusG